METNKNHAVVVYEKNNRYMPNTIFFSNNIKPQLNKFGYTIENIKTSDYSNNSVSQKPFIALLISPISDDSNNDLADILNKTFESVKDRNELLSTGKVEGLYSNLFDASNAFTKYVDSRIYKN